MAKTVIGIFKNSTEAQNAKEHLLKNGFSHQNVDVYARTAADSTDNITRPEQDQDFEDRVGNFFKNLFGDSDEATNYSRAASRGVVVTVHAQNATEAETAADILDEYGAVDVDEYAGGKRIHSRIVERPVEETIRLREEHVNIERNPADRPHHVEDDARHQRPGII